MRMIQVPDAMCPERQTPTFISTEVIDRIVVCTELRKLDGDTHHRDWSRVVLFVRHETRERYNYASPWITEGEAVALAGELLDAIEGKR